MEETPLLETVHLSKSFGSLQAVSDLNLRIGPGEVYALLGPNGSGKTTALSLIVGLLRPSRGTVRFHGSPGEMAGFIGAPPIYPHLSGYTHLCLAYRARGLSPDPRRIEKVLDLVGLIEAQHRKAGAYSTGMRQRLGIAKALLFPARLIILDEPTSGLDPEGVLEIRRLIRGLQQEQGITILFSSHLLGEVEQVATRVGIIVEGRLCWEECLETLHQEKSFYEVETSSPGQARKAISSWGTIVEDKGNRLVVRLHDGITPEQLNLGLLQKGVLLSRLGRKPNRLEATYLEVCHGVAF